MFVKVSSNPCFCPHLWEIVYSGHKNLRTALNKKHASRDLRSIWVLKNPFIKKNVEHSQAEIVKNWFQEINFVKNI